MATSPRGDVVRLMDRVLGATFAGTSYDPWRAVLRAAFALSLTEEERAFIALVTGRQNLPPAPVRELWLLLGRRAGKSLVAALLAIWACCCRSYTLAPGEVGVYAIIASDRRQGRVIKNYASGLLRSHPALAALVARETADAIHFTNGLVIEIHTCSFRTVRGHTVIGASLDEVSFWHDENSANPDHEVVLALQAAMASQPTAMLVGLTSVYARRGVPWRQYERHFGRDTPDVLVVSAATRAMNPTIRESLIAAAYESDPIAADAEYGAVFRRDVEAFLPAEVLEAARVPGRFELPYQRAHQYVAFIDPAGGTGADSMTLAIAHRERGRAVLDVARETRPPFSPEAVTREFAATIRGYGLARATSDRYAGDWPTEAFRKFGVTVAPSERTRSEIYLAVLPMLMSGQAELLDVPRLLHQFGSLERRKGRQGRDSVDAPPRQHEDLANAVAGAVALAGLRKPKSRAVWGRGHDRSLAGAPTPVGESQGRVVGQRRSASGKWVPMYANDLDDRATNQMMRSILEGSRR